MNRAVPVRDDVIYLGNDINADASDAGTPVQDAPPLEINDTPPRESHPWIAPQPTKRDDLNDGSADA